MILSIRSKLGLNYINFFSTFHSTKLALGTSYKMHTLDAFVASILQEKYNFSQMGIQNTSKVHSVASNEEKKGAKNKNCLCDKHLKLASTQLSLKFKQSHQHNQLKKYLGYSVKHLHFLHVSEAHTTSKTTPK